MRRHLSRLAALLVALAVGLLLLALHDRPPITPGAWLAAASLEARHETIDGRRLRFVRAGSGPAVVLVHGFGSSLYTWKDVIPALTASHDVVALDLPGFGESDQPADLSFEDLPRAVLGLMDRLGIERASLVGNSMGGATAAIVAAERPQRVDALVLIDAAGFSLGPSERPRMVSLAMSRAGSLLARLPGKRLVVEASLRQVFHDASRITPERLSEYLAAASRPGTFPAIRSLGASTGDRQAVVAQSLPRIRARALVLWGDDDRWIPIAHADRFVAAIPGARKVVIPACGHLPQEEKPEEVARLLLEFLAEAGFAGLGRPRDPRATATPLPPGHGSGGSGDLPGGRADRASGPARDPGPPRDSRAAAMPVPVTGGHPARPRLRGASPSDGQRRPRLTSVSRAFCAIGLCGYWRTMTSNVATPSARRPDET